MNEINQRDLNVPVRNELLPLLFDEVEPHLLEDNHLQQYSAFEECFFSEIKQFK